MKVEIRDITKEEAVPYGDNADIVLAERKAVVFTDDAGNTGKLYMKEEDVELLGEQYIAENSKMEYAQKSGADSTPAATSCGNFATNRSLVG